MRDRAETEREKPRPSRGKPASSREKPDDGLKIAGLPAVTALFERNPDLPQRLFIDERLVPETSELCRIMTERHKLLRIVETEELNRIAGTPLHGGILAVTSPRPPLPFDLQEARGWAKAGQPLLILDGVGNPHNLGAIARTMAFFGMERLVISDHPGQAGASEAAWRVAEGGLEYVKLHRAHNLPEMLHRLQAFYLVVGTALGRGRPVEELRRDTRPLAVVMGNEEHGLSPASAAACEDILTIPGSGWIQSLNVAATTAILVHALAPKRL
ncbi:MAG: RNA methyltransferase [Rhodospirillales bacterium]|nr:RNA methyltransferase [Rhodospirillales bacterium]